MRALVYGQINGFVVAAERAQSCSVGSWTEASVCYIFMGGTPSPNNHMNLQNTEQFILLHRMPTKQ